MRRTENSICVRKKKSKGRSCDKERELQGFRDLNGSSSKSSNRDLGKIGRNSFFKRTKME